MKFRTIGRMAERGIEPSLVAWLQSNRSADGMVGIGAGRVPVFGHAPRRRRPNLALARGVALEVKAIKAVDGGAHGNQISGIGSAMGDTLPSRRGWRTSRSEAGLVPARLSPSSRIAAIVP